MFYTIFAELSKQKGLSPSKAAELMGFNRSNVSSWKSKCCTPRHSALVKIADFFGVTVDYLLGNESHLKLPTITPDTITFPVIGEISAGYNEIAIEDWGGETIEIPASYLAGRDISNFFVLKVHGDSMYPIYQNDDCVLILKQDFISRSGEIGAILYDDEIATLKKIEYVQGEQWLRLIPLNPTFPPKTIEGTDMEHCKIIGVPRLLIRNIK